MNRTLLVSIALILAVVGFYFLWEFNHQSATRPWDLVSEEALIAYEYRKNSTHDYTDLLIKPFLPDSLRNTLLGVNELLVSAHLISKDEMGIVLYLSGSPLVEKKMTSAIKSSRSYRERIFDGFKIVEGSISGNQVVSATAINDVFVMSSSSLLIEDVIRLANSKEKQNFIEYHQTIFQFAQTKPDSGNVYIDLSHLVKFFNFFLSAKDQNPILDRFAQSAVVEIKRQKQNLLLSGFALDSLSKGASILSLFNRQRPVPITLQRIVSNRAGLLVHFGITDFTLWNQDRLEFCRTTNPWVADSLNALNTMNGFDANQFYQALGDEMGVCQSGIFSGEILMVELKNVAQAESQLKKLVRKKELDRLSTENYSHYQIHFLDVPTLSRILFWPLTNRKMRYYLIADHHLIFSEKLEDLKSFVSDMDTENTWGKMSEWNDFLSTSQDTNMGIIFDALNWWPSLRNNLNLKWQGFGDSTHFLNFSKGSFQFSRLEKSYYFNGVLKFNPQRLRDAFEEKEKTLEITLTQPVTSALTVVRNHASGRSELLVQDESNALKLFSTGLKSLFTTQVAGKIKSEIHQIDFYKNKKLQYVFATERSLWLIDRLGNTVKGFPKTISGENPIEFLTVIDYDHARNYRFLISDKKGTLIQYDREGRPLSDWKKVELKGELLVAPRPVRTMGKDYLIAMTRNGMVYGFNRKGEPLNGFPVNLKWRPAGSWFFETANDQKVITVMSEDGVVVQIDLKGKIINEANLVKSSAASRFSLVTSPDLDNYVISRIDRGKMAVLNSKGEVIFEKENPGSDELFLTYFELAHGRKLFGFTDPQQEFTYFFDDMGRAVFSRPLENQQKPGIAIDKSGSIYFYSVNKNKIQRYQPAPTNP